MDNADQERAATSSADDASPWRRAPGHLARGYAMGMADLVPGVSGGTIALVLGIYERLIGAVKDGATVLARLVRLDLRRAGRGMRTIEWHLVLPVLAGIFTAIVSLARLLSGLLEDHPVTMSALFFGLVVGAVVVTAPDVRRWDLPRLTVGATVAVATFLLLGLRGAPAHDPPLVGVFAAGVIGICGMILPGISGAFILLIVGVYEAALAAIDERDLVFVGIFGLGAVTGLASIGAGLKWLLERYHDTVLAGLIGLMAGSLRVLWPWPGEEVGDPALGVPTSGDLPRAAIAAVVAVGVVVLLGRYGRPEARVEERPDEDRGR